MNCLRRGPERRDSESKHHRFDEQPEEANVVPPEARHDFPQEQGPNHAPLYRQGSAKGWMFKLLELRILHVSRDAPALQPAASSECCRLSGLGPASPRFRGDDGAAELRRADWAARSVRHKPVCAGLRCELPAVTPVRPLAADPHILDPVPDADIILRSPTTNLARR